MDGDAKAGCRSQEGLIIPRIAQSRIARATVDEHLKPTAQLLGHTGPSATFAPPIGPQMNPFLRCPLPPIVVYPDSLRQYDRNGAIPQMRVASPNLL